MPDPSFLNLVNGERVAYRCREGRGPGVLWLGGFHSDMNGNKAQALAAWGARTGRAFLRFDYFGHGASSGEFRQGTLSRWRDDALAVLDRVAQGPQVIVGSSMGGWIALMLARLRPERIAGMVLIAPAADFTEVLMWERMPPEIRRQILEEGCWLRPVPDAEPYPVTRALIEDGRSNLVLTSKIAPQFPVRILHGLADTDVPWQHGVRVAETIEGDVTVTLVKGSDHRMSGPRELELIERTLGILLEDIGA
ncbi:MAG TPA: alpha/beta hydrolase [Rhizomicrobium sp.]|nr:alpha/beta hydrolase [Rhizomicrobium sp.]